MKCATCANAATCKTPEIVKEFSKLYPPTIVIVTENGEKDLLIVRCGEYEQTTAETAGVQARTTSEVHY